MPSENCQSRGRWNGISLFQAEENEKDFEVVIMMFSQWCKYGFWEEGPQGSRSKVVCYISSMLYYVPISEEFERGTKAADSAVH